MTLLNSTETKLSLSDKLYESDVEHIQKLAISTGIFSEEEVDIAVSIARYSLNSSHAMYHFLFMRDENGVPVAYTCYGRIPITDNRYDLCWLMVSPEMQGKGIGTYLLSETENAVRKLGGEHLYLDSSCLETYNSSRAFYLSKGFKEVSRIKDFYREGDDRIVYQKIL